MTRRGLVGGRHRRGVRLGGLTVALRERIGAGMAWWDAPWNIQDQQDLDIKVLAGAENRGGATSCRPRPADPGQQVGRASRSTRPYQPSSAEHIYDGTANNPFRPSISAGIGWAGHPDPHHRSQEERSGWAIYQQVHGDQTGAPAPPPKLVTNNKRAIGTTSPRRRQIMVSATWDNRAGQHRRTPDSQPRRRLAVHYRRSRIT